MTTPRILNARIHAGTWSGDLVGVAAPEVTVTHHATPLTGVTCTHDGANDLWHIAVPIPLEMINDGLQTFVVRDGDSVLTHFSLLAGDALAEDLHAEINLLRDELDILKAAFRAHCAKG